MSLPFLLEMLGSLFPPQPLLAALLWWLLPGAHSSALLASFTLQVVCFIVVNILVMLVDLMPCWPHSWSQPASAACSVSCLMSDQLLEPNWANTEPLLCHTSPALPETPAPLLPLASSSQYEILLFIQYFISKAWESALISSHCPHHSLNP